MSKNVEFYVPKLKEGTLSKEELKEFWNILQYDFSCFEPGMKPIVYEVEEALCTGINLFKHFSYIENEDGKKIGGKIELFGYVISEYATPETRLNAKHIKLDTFWSLPKSFESIFESSVEDFGGFIQSLYSYEIGLNYTQHCLYIKYFHDLNLIPNSVWISVKPDIESAVSESYSTVSSGSTLPDEITNEIFSYIFDIHGSNYIEQCDNYEPLALGGEIMIAGTV